MANKDTLQIDVLLPHKERFTAQNGGAVSTVVYELTRHLEPQDANRITIFGSPIDIAKDGVTFQPLAIKQAFWQSRNASLARAYLAYLATHNHRPDIIEVHGRPQVAKIIAKERPDLRIVLYLHNDPRTIKGTKSIADRKALANQLTAIISITNYVKSCYLDGLGDEAAYKARHFVNLLGVERQIKQPAKRQKQILIAGRMVPEKGILEACQGAVTSLEMHPDWQICLAGGKDFSSASLSDYERRIQQILTPLGKRAKILGHQPLAKVRQLQQQSEICIVPSLWQEPGGLTVLEALSAGAALITTKRGGIPEFATGRAILLDRLTPDDFAQAITALIDDETQRKALQQTAWQDYPFSAKNMAKRAAAFRCELVQ